MVLALNKSRLDNLASDIWKSAERLRGKFKAYEYQNVILPIIVIRRLECVLIEWRAAKADPEQYPFSNKTTWTLGKVHAQEHALRKRAFATISTASRPTSTTSSNTSTTAQPSA